MSDMYTLPKLETPLIGWVDDLSCGSEAHPLAGLQADAIFAMVSMIDTVFGEDALRVEQVESPADHLLQPEGGWTRLDLTGQTSVVSDATLQQVRAMARAAYENAITESESVQDGLFGDPASVVAALKAKLHMVPSYFPRNRMWVPGFVLADNGQ